MRVLEYDPARKNLSEPGLDKANLKRITFIAATDPSHQEFEALHSRLRIPLQTLKEYTDEHERPTATAAGNHTAVIYRAPILRKERLETFSFCTFLSPKTCLVIAKHPVPAVDWFLSLPEETKKEHCRRGTSFLLYVLLEKVMDAYFEEQTRIEEHVNSIEKEVVGGPGQKKIQEIFREKTALIHIERALAANRDVLLEIDKGVYKGMDRETLELFRFVYNDTVQLIDMISTERDILSNTVDVYMTAVSNKLADTVNKLTAWGSLILIPTFIASVYGMNFKNIPELSWRYGYAFALGLMLLSVVALYVYFKRKQFI